MWPNIFLNKYQQPENQLTYNFLCFLSYYSPKEFIEFLINDKLFNNPEIINFEFVYGGEESNPDGCIDILYNDEIFNIFLEVKTHRRQLDLNQIKRHLKHHCKDKNKRLLVITTNKNDINIINSINNDKIIFHTWKEISEFINKNTDIQIANSFVEYIYLEGEFEMSNITKEDLENYSKFIQSRWEDKISNILNETIDSIKENDDLPIKFLEMYSRNAWGRNVIEIVPTKQKYEQWIACGIYYNTKDHKIPFKKNGIPELCFFFDIDRNEAKNLPKNIKDAIKNLKKYGFEENVDGTITPNRWRLFFKRRPLDEIELLDPSSLKKFLYDCINDIKSEPELLKLI